MAKKTVGKKNGKTAGKKKPATGSAQPPAPNATATAGAAEGRLIPPPGGATVRMYRIGHGDCFLIAFAGDVPNRPAYVLIDCGYKPGSPGKINPPAGVTSAKEITADIKKATGGSVDVAVITHEHQDHVNGITATNFDGIAIGEAWFAWTEDPIDGLANDLRKKFKDKLLGLIAARNRLAAAGGEDHRVQTIDEFLAFELGGEDEQFNAAAAVAMLGANGDAGASMNKASMKIFKDKATKGVEFLRPHEKIYTVPGAKQVRVFPLGPPRDPDLLESLDPTGSEEFGPGMAVSSCGSHFAAAARAAGSGDSPEAPFAQRYALPWNDAFTSPDDGTFFKERYGQHPSAIGPDTAESPSDAEWRRIDKDWLYAADQLALDMNDQTNNASLVLAFELGKGGKILLFAADAQRGNWLSWAKKAFTDGNTQITARNLLSRTVLYKVGHHGSHNATINGLSTDGYTNLAWMGSEGTSAREFCAMITAVRKWAETQKGWDHPLKAIKEALLKKAAGRVFQTDTDFDQMKMADGGSQVDWDAFAKRTTPNRLYFDYRIEP